MILLSTKLSVLNRVTKAVLGQSILSKSSVSHLNSAPHYDHFSSVATLRSMLMKEKY